MIVDRVIGRGSRVMFSTAAFHAKVRGSFPGFGGLKETKLFLPHPLVKLSIVGSFRDPEVACSTSRPPGFEFRILCLEGSVISLSSPSSGGSPGPIYPKPRFILFPPSPGQINILLVLSACLCSRIKLRHGSPRHTSHCFAKRLLKIIKSITL